MKQKDTKTPPPDTKMSPREKEDLIDQEASADGPDPHEKHGPKTPKKKHEPGVARS